MTPLPIDLAPPPVFVPFHRLRGLARRLHDCLLGCKQVWLQRTRNPLGTKDTPLVTPPMPLDSRLRATHIASATYKGLRGFERWVR